MSHLSRVSLFALAVGLGLQFSELPLIAQGTSKQTFCEDIASDFPMKVRSIPREVVDVIMDSNQLKDALSSPNAPSRGGQSIFFAPRKFIWRTMAPPPSWSLVLGN